MVWKIAKYVITTIIGAIFGAIVVGRIVEWVVGPESYKIYLVGNVRGGIAKDVFDGFKERAKERNLKIDRVRIEIKEVDDRGDPQSAAEISSRLAEANDALFVVGHIFSTVTKEALPNYLRAQPPIPVILTTETNPDLQPAKVPGVDYYPLYRLSPTDDVQAKRAASFAIRNGDTVFWVVEDTSNSVYSKYLALEFIRAVQQEGKSVLLWSNNFTIPSLETIKALDINCVFFAGYWSNGLILIRQIQAIWKGKKMPRIILSDASAHPDLINQGRKDVEGVYLTYPLKASDYKDQRWKLYGTDAYNIIETLVKESDDKFASKRKKQARLSYWLRRLLNMHRVNDARAVIASVMEDAAGDDKAAFEGKLGQYVFAKDGTRKNAEFHVWQVERGNFVDVSGP